MNHLSSQNSGLQLGGEVEFELVGDGDIVPSKEVRDGNVTVKREEDVRLLPLLDLAGVGHRNPLDVLTVLFLTWEGLTPFNRGGSCKD